MAINSKIEWTESTWNPVTGCTKISAGCKHCYAETLTNRFESIWGAFSEVKLHPNRLELPIKKKTPTLYFVNSMSDIFHKDIPDDFILKIFKVMNNSPRHTFQVLTKRPERLKELNKKINWTSNIWMGVTIENKLAYKRLLPLIQSDAKTKFLSIEPLLESVSDINLDGIDWVILGGESGPNARPMKEEWAIEIRKLCSLKKIPFFFKQWGGVRKKNTGRLLRGKEYNQMPKTYKSSEFRQNVA
ncbi:DUF5131 family protein [Leptospira bandrabouensis]|uniref:DUF5131 family protein n=1 Tax=Leptospira bandrabouensis TaxID=2484903 RepID=UPI0010914BBE|nr:phage Gp37/Gp68 family protein [Leptospira bandrabouensis]TGN08601.1 phage Gp37/Gp68 family protein [Leptospira bandrabouensis]